ncbi:MAG: dCTP deaminase [candidate division Zixibacteria bacterium]|nr:dCTP deaminase [candidate division Zixibacteria bacterium]
MPVMPDSWIIKMAKEKGMIEPFAESQVRENVISFGVSSYGYDFRVADEFKIPADSAEGIIDPKEFDLEAFEDSKGDHVMIPPRSFVIARTVEFFRIPRDILTICTGKSTYSRCGILVNITPFEPEWEGHATFGISNVTNLPAKVYANEGIGQLIFLRADKECDISYKDKKGKYQGTKGITISKVDS